MTKQKIIMLPSIFALIILVLFSINSFAVEDNIDKKLHESCIYPTIQIRSPKALGTGAITRSIKIEDDIYLNVFLSCNHIILPEIKEDYEVVVFNYSNWSTIKDEENFKCYFYAQDEDRDLSIGFFISNRKLFTVDVDINPDLYISDKITSCGTAGNDIPRLEEATITSPIIRNKVRTSLHIMPGDSGGPVFKNYKFIGVINSIGMYKDQLLFSKSYFISNKKFEEWNKENNNELEFAWNKEFDWPKLIYEKLNFYKNYKITK